jgi:hypothetical protein
MKEEIEKKQLNKQENIEGISLIEKENTIKEIIEIKEKKEKQAKEDNEKSPWLLINPELLIPEVVKIFIHYNREEYKSAKSVLESSKELVEKISNKEKRNSNEKFLKMIDDKIIIALDRQEAEEQEAKDNKR